MVRPILAVVIGLVGAAIVHIAVIFAMPLLATNNAWGRLSRIAEMNQVVRIVSVRPAGSTLPDTGPGIDDFAFIDPAFITVGCRFSLADGPVRLQAPDRTDFWSASIYSRQGDNLYSINDRSAVDGRFDLLVGTPAQLSELRLDSAARDETAIPVGLEITEGYLTLRVLVDEESIRPEAEALVKSVACAPFDPPTATAAPRTG